MKKKKTIEYKGQVFEIVFFSNEAREDIRQRLANYPTKKVDLFLFEIELMCAFQFAFENHQNSPIVTPEKIREQRKSIKNVIKGLKKALRNLKDIQYQRTAPYLDLDPTVAHYSKVFVGQIIEDSVRPKIDLFYRYLEMIPVSAGRPPKYDETVLEVAKSYQKYIDRPTTTKTGPCFDIVQKVICLLESKDKLPASTDPSRAIRKALKTLTDATTNDETKEIT